MSKTDTLIWSQPGLKGGVPCIRGRRVPVSMVASLARDSVDLAMATWGLSRDEVEAALAFDPLDLPNENRTRGLPTN